GHVKTIPDRSDDLASSIDAGSDKKVAEPDRWRANQGARGVGRRAQTQFARRIGIEQIIFQDPIFDNDRAPRRQTFAVEGTRTDRAAHLTVVNDRQFRRGDRFAEAAYQERRAAKDRIAVNGPEKVTQQFFRRARFKDNRRFLSRNFTRVKLAQRPPRRFAAEFFRRIERR